MSLRLTFLLKLTFCAQLLGLAAPRPRDPSCSECEEGGVDGSTMGFGGRSVGVHEVEKTSFRLDEEVVEEIESDL